MRTLRPLVPPATKAMAFQDFIEEASVRRRAFEEQGNPGPILVAAGLYEPPPFWWTFQQANRGFHQTAFRTTDYGPNHLPRDRDGIPRDLLVTAHENEVLDLSLCDENPVERVPVMVGQRRDVQRVPEVNRQDLKAVDRHVFGHEVLEVLRQPQPSNPRLDRKLPSACDTQEDLVPLSRDQLSRLRREPRIVADPPEERMRVEQQPHDPKKRRSLAGRGASKFPFIVNRPRALPGSRRAVRSENGTRRATGRPAFPITISSPWLNRTRSFEKWVLASWTFTTFDMPRM